MNPTTRASNPTFRALSCISRTSHLTPKYRTCLSYSAVPIRDLSTSTASFEYWSLVVPISYWLLPTVPRFDLYPSVRELLLLHPFPLLDTSLIRWFAHLWELSSVLSQSSCHTPLSPSLHTTSIPANQFSLGSCLLPPIPFSWNISVY